MCPERVKNKSQDTVKVVKMANEAHPELQIYNSSALKARAKPVLSNPTKSIYNTAKVCNLRTLTVTEQYLLVQFHEAALVLDEFGAGGDVIDGTYSVRHLQVGLRKQLSHLVVLRLDLRARLQIIRKKGNYVS